MDMNIAIPWSTSPSQNEKLEFMKILEKDFMDRFLFFAFKLTNDWHIAEDCVQEAFYAAWNKLPEFTQEDNVIGWLLTTIRNIAFDSNERLKMRFMVKLENLEFSVSKINPHTITIEEEEKRQLQKAVHSLPSQQKNALLLHYMEGLTYAEIGGILGCSAESAKKYSYLAKISIRSFLSRSLQAALD